MVELVPLLREVHVLRCRAHAPPPERLVEVEHADVREIGHPRDRLEKPEAGEGLAVEEVVEGEAQDEVGGLDHPGGPGGWVRFGSSRGRARRERSAGLGSRVKRRRVVGCPQSALDLRPGVLAVPGGLVGERELIDLRPGRRGERRVGHSGNQ